VGRIFEADDQDPRQDNRVPDIVVIPNFGTSYAPADEQGIAAHGGFSDDDTHVALLLSSPGLSPRIIRTPVQTMQVAPTILQALGIDPGSLQAVHKRKPRFCPVYSLDEEFVAIVEFRMTPSSTCGKSSGETRVTSSISQEE